jgi:hypothetical protein
VVVDGGTVVVDGETAVVDGEAATVRRSFIVGETFVGGPDTLCLTVVSGVVASGANAVEGAIGVETSITGEIGTPRVPASSLLKLSPQAATTNSAKTLKPANPNFIFIITQAAPFS